MSSTDIIGAAAVARAWSGYFDSLVGGWVQTSINDQLPSFGFGRPDLLALVVTLLLTVVVMVGVKESARLNNLLTGLNLCVIGFIIVAGTASGYTDKANWQPFIPPQFGVSVG